MRLAVTILAATSVLALAGCGTSADNDPTPKSQAARDAAGDKTIASGFGRDDTKFAEAAKASGLDATLAGPGPYTVLVPTNAAFDKLPAGTFDSLMKAEARPKLTKLLTAHIMPGAILVADIAKAIDTGKGKATLATFGGDTLTATKQGGQIVLTDPAGAKASIVASDEKRSNGVVQHLDGVLKPN